MKFFSSSSVMTEHIWCGYMNDVQYNASKNRKKINCANRSSNGYSHEKFPNLAKTMISAPPSVHPPMWIDCRMGFALGPLNFKYQNWRLACSVERACSVASL